MLRLYTLFFALTLSITGLSTAVADTPDTIHHQLQVKLSPGEGRLTVSDKLTLPGAVTHFEFYLHQGLNPGIKERGITLTPTVRQKSGEIVIEGYRLTSATPFREVTLSYNGIIQHQLDSIDDDYSSGRKSSPGLISEKGVFLSSGGFWYPVTAKGLVSFDMSVDLPTGWSAVSQGSARDDGNGWSIDSPQDDIYLIAAPYHRYIHQSDIAEAQVYLRRKDPALAKRYLDATEHYLSLYHTLLGPYPYSKFALVENFWESGYGMPSFTLLGPQVIRLPFILHSSYPHEILHNWWGNGVYVDYGSGNWSEGLTSYLADHLIKEQRGKGADYRRSTLQRYTDYVDQQKEFPLVEFKGRHGQVSQAIGYGKTLMLFHMLRMQLGDERFIDGLRRFYRQQQFRSAGYDDLRKSFEQATDESLSQFFQQWTKRSGAPALVLSDTKVSPADGGYRLTAKLKQTQSVPPFALRVPLFIQMEGDTQPLKRQIVMSKRERQIDIALEKRPVRLSVDPGFDLFRKLDPSEIPSSLGQLFGSDRLTIVLPNNAGTEIRAGYQELAEAWAKRGKGIDIVWDSELKQLPKNRTLWIFGRENRFADLFNGLLEEDEFKPAQQSYALTRRRPGNPQLSMGLLHSAGPKALPGLARKLPHYSKYSYVVFEGDRPTNRLKGQWQLSESALTVNIGTEKAPAMIVPTHTPLSNIAQKDPVKNPPAESISPGSGQ
ncbi:MAG: M1 family aminopeptidase [Candidatus Sedimenticola sp. (ex Thyasira tokunagai)]